jgi:hypothetical protein
MLEPLHPAAPDAVEHWPELRGIPYSLGDRAPATRGFDLAGGRRGRADPRGVQHVSYSFADEFADKLVAGGDDLAVEITHTSETVGRTVEDAMRRRTAPLAC